MTEKKINVLHTENGMDYTGGFKALYDYMIKEKEKIQSVVVLPVGSRCTSLLEKEGIKVYEVPFVELRKDLFSLVKYIPYLFLNAWKIYRIAKKEKISVLHGNDLYNLSLYLVKYVYRFKAPLVVHIRLMPSSYPKVLYDFWRNLHLRYSDALVAVSHAVTKAYGYSSKLHTVYDIAAIPEKHPAYQFTFNPQAGRPFRFLYLANYTKGKGQELALEAFGKMKVQAHLTFAGGTLGRLENDEFKKSLQDEIDSKGLHSKVKVEDFVTDVEKEMKQYDAVLNFSTAESFSFTSYDALRYGVPLIATDCGGPAELFENGKSGILVANRDVAAMAGAMDQLCQDSQLAQRLSVESKKYINELLFRSNRFEYLSELFISLSKQNKSYGAH